MPCLKGKLNKKAEVKLYEVQGTKMVIEGLLVIIVFVWEY